MIDCISYEGRDYFRSQLFDCDTETLRTMVRHFRVERKDALTTGTMIAGMKKEVCVDWLLQTEAEGLISGRLNGSEWQEPVVSGSNGRYSVKDVETVEVPSPVANRAETLLKAMAEALGDQIKNGSVDRAEIDKWVKEELETQVKGLDQKYRELIDGKIVRIEVWDKKEGKRILGVEEKQHFMFAHILKMAQLRLNIALVGPAGSGKTHICAQIAKALSLKFEPISVGPQTSQSQLMGYMDANGNYIETAFYRAYKNGGVILLDEFDAAHPGVATCINGATANSGAGFPCGYVLKHPDCIVIIAMNTWGAGASTAYVGRQPQDKATMNRFAFVEFNYDEKLERELSEHKEWCEWVQRARKSLFKLGAEGKDGVRHIISPRASYAGSKMLNAGMDRKFVEDSVVWQGLAKSEVAKILSGMA